MRAQLSCLMVIVMMMMLTMTMMMNQPDCLQHRRGAECCRLRSARSCLLRRKAGAPGAAPSRFDKPKQFLSLYGVDDDNDDDDTIERQVF